MTTPRPARHARHPFAALRGAGLLAVSGVASMTALPHSPNEDRH